MPSLFTANAIAQVEWVDTIIPVSYARAFTTIVTASVEPAAGPFNLTHYFPKTPNGGAVARGDPKNLSPHVLSHF